MSGEPRYVPMLICDHVVGEIAAGAVLAAVMQQRASGALEIPMFETMANFVLQEHLAQKSFVPPVGPAGDQRLLNSHNKPVETADGWIAFTANTDKQVKAFLLATGRDDLMDDPRFASVAARVQCRRMVRRSGRTAKRQDYGGMAGTVQAVRYRQQALSYA